MAYPILAAKYDWWKPNVSTVTKSSITEIEIMDSYTPDSSVTVVDSWDASAAQDGSITCYVIGTKLIIAGNGSGKIAANEDFSYCFFLIKNATAILGLNLLDVSNVTNGAGVFAYCYKLVSVDLSNWDTSNITNMESMFENCGALTAVGDLSNWDVSNVTSMLRMFCSCAKLTTVGDLSNWNVSNVTQVAALFYGCSALTSIGDLSSWNTSQVTTFDNMFAGCSALTSVGDLSNWDVSNATDIQSMFDICERLTTVGDLSNWDVSKITNMSRMFNYCSALTSIGDISNWGVSNVTNMSLMFEGCSKLTGIGDLANWDTSSCTDMSFMFWGASSIKEIDVSKWDVSKVTNFDHFAAHAGLRRKGIENWNTSSAINMNAMFHNCAEEELDLSGWDVSKVQFFCQMFENSPNLKCIKGLDRWNTSAGLGFDGMFERCSKLEEVDLSSFNTTKAKNGTSASTNGHTTATLQNMFLSCNNLKKVKLGPNFSINGDGTNTTAGNKLILPTPSTDYIEGADGNWYAFNGDPYAPNAIQDKTAETYFASFPLCQNEDVIAKNGRLINIAKAVKEKTGTTDKMTIAQMSELISGIQAGGGLHVEFNFDGSEVTCNATFKQVEDAFRNCQIGLVTGYDYQNGFDNPVVYTQVGWLNIRNGALSEQTHTTVPFDYTTEPCFVFNYEGWGCHIWLEEAGPRFVWFD